MLLKATVPFMILFMAVLAYDEHAFNANVFEKHEKLRDLPSPLVDIFKKFGIDESVNIISHYIDAKIKSAEKYDNFEEDWKTLKEDPLTIIHFLRNATLPSIMNVWRIFQNVSSDFYFKIMKFTSKKCDSVLGREAALHPWNVIKQGQETVSFLVFVYGISLALILLKLCSFWNFLGWLAIGYFTYAITGPYWCFKWLVFTTGLFWYIFDMVLTYPFHSSLVFIICFFIIPYICSTIWIFGNNSAKFRPNQASIEEFKMLKGKVNNIEYKTDEIQKKVDELARLFQKMDFNQDS